MDHDLVHGHFLNSFIPDMIKDLINLLPVTLTLMFLLEIIRVYFHSHRLIWHIVIKPQITTISIFQKPIELWEVVNQSFISCVGHFDGAVAYVFFVVVKLVHDTVCHIYYVRDSHVFDYVVLRSVIGISKIQSSFQN